MDLIEYIVTRRQLHHSKGDFSKGERIIVVIVSQKLDEKKQVLVYTEI